MTGQDDRDEDVRSVLGRAFGAEPPLGLDRAEILRAGRRKVRQRRIMASGGVAAGVIAVVLGAAVLPNLFSGDGPGEDVAVGTTTTTAPLAPGTAPSTPETAPAGPSLPLTTTTPAPNDVHAEALTATLAGTVVLSHFAIVPTEAGPRVPLAFVANGGGYRTAADLVDEDGAGHLEVEVNYPPEHVNALCEQSSDQVKVECIIDNSKGYPILLTTRTAWSGRIEYTAHSFRDGTEISATSTNVASKDPFGKGATRKAPPLDLDALHKIATNPRLTFR